MKPGERADFLSPLVFGSTKEADDRRQSLTLIRPSKFEITARNKPQQRLQSEKRKHQLAADQGSLFHKQVKPFDPCPKMFRVHWADQDGRTHVHECDDWETAAAFRRFSREYGGADAAVEILQEKYADYFSRGLVLALSTHSRRNIEFGSFNQWLLVGMIRLDETSQTQFGF